MVFSENGFANYGQNLWKCATFCDYLRCNITRSNVSLTLGELYCSPIKCKTQKQTYSCEQLLFICTAMYRKTHTVRKSNRCIAISDSQHCCFSSQYEGCIKGSTHYQCHASTVNYYVRKYFLVCQLSMFSTGRLYALSTKWGKQRFWRQAIATLVSRDGRSANKFRESQIR